MGPGMEVQTFESVTMFGGRRWFFRIVDTGNYEILAQSQTYKSRWQREKTAKRLAKTLGCPIVEGKQR